MYSTYVVGMVAQRAQMVIGAMPLCRNCPPLADIMMKTIGNSQVHNEYMKGLLEAINKTTNGALVNNCLHANQLDQLIGNWIAEFYRMNAQQFQQQQPAVAYGDPMMMGGGVSYGGNTGMGGNVVYDDPMLGGGTPQLQITQQTTPPAQSTGIQNQRVLEVISPKRINLTPENIDLMGQPNKNFIRATKVMADTSSSIRYSVVDLTLDRAENNSVNAYRTAHSTLADCPDYFYGKWVHVLKYNELVHIPMGIERYVHFMKMMTGMVGNHREWRNVIENMKSGTHKEFEIFSDIFTSFFNQLLGTCVRSNRLRSYLQIDNINDVFTMIDDPASITGFDEITKHPSYRVVLEKCIISALGDIFDTNYLIARNDKHLGDFIQCANIKIDNRDGMTEFDHLFSGEDSKLLLDELMSEHTVLRVPRIVMATNAIAETNILAIGGGRPLCASQHDLPITNLLTLIDIDTVRNVDRLIVLRDGGKDDDLKSITEFQISHTLEQDIMLFCKQA